MMSIDAATAASDEDSQQGVSGAVLPLKIKKQV